MRSTHFGRLLRAAFGGSLAAWLLAACTAAPPPPTAIPTLALPTATATQVASAAIPTAPPVAEATATPATAAVEAEPVPLPDWLTTVTVVGDYYILGNPDAPIRLVDYGDFL